MPLYIVDSSVFNKLYLKEDGREEALYLFEQAARGNLTLLAPNLLRYEVIATAQYYRLPIDSIVQLLEKQTRYNLNLIEPTKEQWNRAIDIIKIGHPKSGYPSIYDSIFHAIAIIEDGTLVTADRKHLEKKRQEEHIIMLDKLCTQIYL
ncbi:MAG: type II toxin-antitoxin system VapC family toxin [Desulfobacterales bacterium]|nr:type II toxin-antitoxin system VapC family toxin [Desulfobacterales bacterium]